MATTKEEASNKTPPPGFQSTPGATILVTGSSGFVGFRLVEMLLERGASKVLCFDIVPPSDIRKKGFLKAASTASGGDNNDNNDDDGSKKISYFSGPIDGNLTQLESVHKAFASVPQIDIVYHIAALVGPYHERDQYMKVNYEGTMNILNACDKYNVSRLIFSSSPSTRFTGDDIKGLREDELPSPSTLKTFLALYAETKAYAEIQVTKANKPPTLMTINVAPHQVYGPYDTLFLPSLLETCGSGRLRIFGTGRNKVSFCYNDNYAHGLMCGADSLHPQSKTLGKFYIITDGQEQYFWEIINKAAMEMGFDDLHSKYHLPLWLLWIVAYLSVGMEYITKKKSKLNPFSLKMLIIHRYFSLDNARRDLHYEPLVQFDDGWKRTTDWFKENWLPGYMDRLHGGSKKTKNGDGGDGDGGHKGVFEKKHD